MPDTKTGTDTELDSFFEVARLPKIAEGSAGALSKAEADQQFRGLNMAKVFSNTVQTANGEADADDINLHKIIQDKIDELDRDIASGLNDLLHNPGLQK